MKRFVVVVARLCCFVLLPASYVLAGPLAQFRGVFGEIDVELYDKDKPITVSNFVYYVNHGSYVNTFFDRLATNASFPNFSIQAGGYVVPDPTSTNFVNAVFFVPSGPPITNEFGVGRFFSNTNGTLAMALKPYSTNNPTIDPNSATSEFFFNLGDNSASLDSAAASGTFAVFGHVVSGLDLLGGFGYAFSLDDGIVDEGGAFNSLPVRYSGGGFPSYKDLLYVDITMLNVQVTNQTGLSQISWNSVNNQTNVVEYTTKFPAAWQTLTNLVGNGSATNVVDTGSSNANRFYRVRVAY